MNKAKWEEDDAAADRKHLQRLADKQGVHVEVILQELKQEEARLARMKNDLAKKQLRMQETWGDVNPAVKDYLRSVGLQHLNDKIRTGQGREGREGWTALHCAIEDTRLGVCPPGVLSAVSKKISHALLSARTPEGTQPPHTTALSLLVRSNAQVEERREAFEILQRRGIDLHEEHYVDRTNLLHTAAGTGSAWAVVLLLEARVEVNHRDNLDRHPLNCSMQSNAAVSQMLREAGGTECPDFRAPGRAQRGGVRAYGQRHAYRFSRTDAYHGRMAGSQDTGGAAASRGDGADRPGTDGVAGSRDAAGSQEGVAGKGGKGDRRGRGEKGGKGGKRDGREKGGKGEKRGEGDKGGEGHWEYGYVWVPRP